MTTLKPTPAKIPRRKRAKAKASEVRDWRSYGKVFAESLWADGTERNSNLPDSVPGELLTA